MRPKLYFDWSKEVRVHSAGTRDARATTTAPTTGSQTLVHFPFARPLVERARVQADRRVACLTLTWLMMIGPESRLVLDNRFSCDCCHRLDALCSVTAKRRVAAGGERANKQIDGDDHPNDEMPLNWGLPHIRRHSISQWLMPSLFPSLSLFRFSRARPTGWMSRVRCL